ncbi:MAG: nitroreductase family protein [Synergistales bacterium]|jgi:nitroreductase
MGFLELVEKRESCRSFLRDPVEREKIERCLEAARLAPSACNGQPWRFVVVESEPLKSTLAERAFSGIHKMNAFAKEAPVLVAVVTLPTRAAATFAGLFRRFSYPLIDIGIACEHFVLQAAEEGLGTCWLGWFDDKSVGNLIGLGFREKVHVLLAVGYGKDKRPAAKMRKPLREMSEYR